MKDVHKATTEACRGKIGKERCNMSYSWQGMLKEKKKGFKITSGIREPVGLQLNKK